MKNLNDHKKKKKNKRSSQAALLKHVNEQNSDYVIQEKGIQEHILSEIKKGKLSQFNKKQKLELAREILSSNNHS